MSPVRTAPAPLTARDAALRAQYLTEVLAVLYPEPCETGSRRPWARKPWADNRIADYLVVPDARSPRLLLPAGSRRVAAAAVQRYAEPQSRMARLKRNAVVAALRTGASTVLLRDRVRISGPAEDTINTYLCRALGVPLAISIHIGPARANRKPVLQLLSPAGETIGFAKLGTGPLTRRLVRAETTALTALDHVRLRHVTVPRVLHSGQWNGHQVLVQSVLPIWRPRTALPARRLAEAMLEVASCCGISQGWLATSPYWAELSDRLNTLAEQANAPDEPAHHTPEHEQNFDWHRARERSQEAGQLRAAARSLASRVGDLPLRYGAWHGDWAPWNMAGLSDTVLLWDWERFSSGVPVGFDAIHYELQRRIQTSTDATAAVEATVARAETLLAPFDVAPEAREVTALLYLVDLAARYLADRQAEAGARLGVLGSWLLPVLIARVSALSEAQPRESRREAR
jgi:hypothetical protein